MSNTLYHQDIFIYIILGLPSNKIVDIQEDTQTRSSSLPMSLLLASLKLDGLIRQGLCTLPTTLFL